MVVGTTLMYSTTPYYSPTFPRGGEAATFAVDVTHLDAGVTFDVTVEHKNAEDTSWTSAGAFTGIAAVGLGTKDVSSLKEELRLKYSFSAGSSGDMVHIVVPAPQWRPY